MTSLYSSMTIIFAEISIILAVLIGLIVTRYIRNQRQLKSCLVELAGKINDNRQNKLAMLQKLLEQTCQYPAEQAKKTATTLLEKEIHLYTALMNIYLHQNHQMLATIDQHTDEVISAYRDLLTIAAASINHNTSTESDQRIQELTDTVKELTNKNNQLSKEVADLNNEMNVTVSEYTSVFHAGSDAASDADDATHPTENPSRTSDRVDSQQQNNNGALNIDHEEISNLESNMQQSEPNTTVISRIDDDELAQELNELAASLDEENVNPAIALDELDEKPG